MLFSGITNYEEYSLIQEVTEDKKEDGVGTLKKDRTLLQRDERKMEKLKAKLHTDDDCEWRRKESKKAPSGVVESVYIIMEMKLTQRHHLDVLRLSIVIHRTDISVFHEIISSLPSYIFKHANMWLTLLLWLQN